MAADPMAWSVHFSGAGRLGAQGAATSASLVSASALPFTKCWIYLCLSLFFFKPVIPMSSNSSYFPHHLLGDCMSVFEMYSSPINLLKLIIVYFQHSYSFSLLAHQWTLADLTFVGWFTIRFKAVKTLNLYLMHYRSLFVMYKGRSSITASKK